MLNFPNRQNYLSHKPIKSQPLENELGGIGWQENVGILRELLFSIFLLNFPLSR